MRRLVALTFVPVVAAVIAAGPSATGSDARQNGLPPLPTLDPPSYSTPAREAITPLQRPAAARSTDPQAVGALARMLQAWEQLEAAHQAYERAQALAPHSFEWLYLDGVVLERLARHREAAQRFERPLTQSPRHLPAPLALPPG